ncbi:phosphoenolpyruvate-protein phosphotransferase [Clostridia bacterium]|nr:phosphoenolpyruvate-protein phosphotransferase [Clostridia bacterium]
MQIVKGTPIFSGVAIGPLRFISEVESVPRQTVTEPHSEVVRFEAARQSAMEQLDALYKKALAEIGAEDAAIFDIHGMMLDDLDYRDAVTETIRNEHVCAEFAVHETMNKFAANFAAMSDDYMKARATDVRDISKRVLAILTPDVRGVFSIITPSIIAAKDLSPSETVSLERSLILGLATNEGSVTSHTSILARSMGIPAAIGLGSGLNVECDGLPAILDGFTGTLYIEPDANTIEVMTAKQTEAKARQNWLESLKGQPNTTEDGASIDIFANAGGLPDIDSAVRHDAGGVGLFRSEFIYLDSADYPTEDEQFIVYKQAAERLNGKKIVFRTLDIGADKQAEYFKLPAEENPAMGLRAIRICLTRPEIFRTQLRALYRASAFGNIAIMFPMITAPREVVDALEIAESVKAELSAEGIAFDEKLEIGIMVETPAAVMMSAELAKMVDFFSIGTNDLTQYTLAVDRQNNGLSSFYDPRHPAVLRLIEKTVQSAHAADIWVGICGELGADLELTETFLRMGVDELSVSAGMVLPLREKVRSLNLTHA